jgi:type I restriction enzyme S subunit
LHASGAIDNLIIPFKEDVYLKFQEILIPIFNKMVKNKSENQKLTELRDWLLPMLMNGQVGVRD